MWNGRLRPNLILKHPMDQLPQWSWHTNQWISMQKHVVYLLDSINYLTMRAMQNSWFYSFKI